MRKAREGEESEKYTPYRSLRRECLVLLGSKNNRMHILNLNKVCSFHQGRMGLNSRSRLLWDRIGGLHSDGEKIRRLT